MTGSIDIINTEVLNAGWDVFWTVNDLLTDVSHFPVLILTTKYLESSEDTQLQKMLQACNLTPEQYRILQLEPHQQLAWHQLRDTIKAKYILLIGINPQQLGMAAMFRLNEPNHFNDCILIPTLSLQEWEKQPETKKQLWNSGLKPVFIDKSFGNI